MFAFDNIIISDEILETRFSCDLNICRGLCCTGGDFGAPLSGEEAAFFNDNRDEFEKFPIFYTRRFKKYGVTEKTFIKRLNGETYCTATCNNGDCVFSFNENGAYQCYLQRNSGPFKKPVSCYLFPIREKIIKGITYLNLYVYDECQSCYNETSPPLIFFLKNNLIERYGMAFFKALEAEFNKRSEWTPINGRR